MIKKLMTARIQTKLAIGPIVMVILFTMVAAVLWRALDTGSRSLDAISAAAIDLQFAVSDLSEATIAANSYIYQIMALGAAMNDDASLQAIAAGFTDDMARLEKLMAAVEAAPADDSYREVIAAARTGFDAYVVEAVGAVEMATIDVSTAVFMMSTAEAAYDDLALAISVLRNMVRDSASGLIFEAQAEADSSTLLAILLSVAAILIGWSVAWLTARSVRIAVVELSETAQKIADGALESAIGASDRPCEIGQMAKSLDFLRARAKAARDLTEEVAAQNEERTRRAEKVDKLISSFDQAVEHGLGDMNSAFGTLTDSSNAISEGAAASDSIAVQVAAAAEEASRNVGTVASAAEELSASIAEVDGLARRSSAVVADVSGRATAADGKVRDLARAASRIGEVTQLITDIASQTNLLALNATIEAARAGNAGKGFAVVASEVKSLASETEKATNEISTQIGAIQAITQDVVQAIGHVNESIGDVESAMSTLAETVGQQANATQMIAQNASEASVGTNEVTARISEASAQVSTTKGSAEDVLTTVARCTGAGKSLQKDIEGFLDEVRVA